ncbi:hypothetical protein GCM10009037_26850 [Halarchaeum grantii]|uniref:Uncharacterized protein n=1 Tax=Halarchaeum grantii TaxID=1193105 RepID=A0A830EXL9_9EURY|nr:hypothetical protein GCM10009037_26850 [Halarchaeum grantii]
MYYRITSEVFANPLDRGLESKLRDNFKRKLQAETHREVAQSRLNSIEVNTSDGFRDQDVEPIEFPSVSERTQTEVITDKMNLSESMSIKKNGVQFPVTHRNAIPVSRKFIVDVDLAAFNQAIDPLYPYEDHIVINLSSNIHKHNNNGTIAILKLVDDASSPNFNLPPVAGTIELDNSNWVYEFDDLTSGFKEIVTESVQEGEISTIERYTDVLSDLIIYSIDKRQELLDENNIREEAEIGSEVANQLQEMSVHLYMKLSQTKNTDETYEVHAVLDRHFSNALNEEFLSLADAIIDAIDQYYGRHLDEVHARNLGPISEDVVRIVRDSIRKRGIRSNEATNPLREGVWLHAVEMNYTVLLRSLQTENGTQLFSKFWLHCFRQYKPKSRPRLVEERRDVLPLIWYASMGYVVKAWQSGPISDADMETMVSQITESERFKFRNICGICHQGLHYTSDSSRSVNFAKISNSETNIAHGVISEGSEQELLYAAFVFFATEFVCRTENPKETIDGFDPLTTDDIESITEYIHSTGSFKLSWSNKKLETDQLYELLLEELPRGVQQRFRDNRESGDRSRQHVGDGEN